MTIKAVKVGQIVFVRYEGLFGRGASATLEKYRIERYNGSSFYAVPVERDTGREKRFSRRSWHSKDGLGQNYQAYENDKEFYAEQELITKRRELRKKIEDALPGMSLESLTEAWALIEKLQEVRDGSNG